MLSRCRHPVFLQTLPLLDFLIGPFRFFLEEYTIIKIYAGT